MREPTASWNRYSIGAELLVNAESDEEARVLVGNFLDSFPSQIEGHDGDVMMQDVTLVEADVEREDG